MYFPGIINLRFFGKWCTYLQLWNIFRIFLASQTRQRRIWLFHQAVLAEKLAAWILWFPKQADLKSINLYLLKFHILIVHFPSELQQERLETMHPTNNRADHFLPIFRQGPLFVNKGNKQHINLNKLNINNSFFVFF